LDRGRRWIRSICCCNFGAGPRLAGCTSLFADEFPERDGERLGMCGRSETGTRRRADLVGGKTPSQLVQWRPRPFVD
jgi:hypothetical protein